MSPTRTVPQTARRRFRDRDKPITERQWFVGQFRLRIKGKLSRPLTGTANWIIVRGDARPVVAVANRIGHNRRLVRTAMYAANGWRERPMHRAPTSLATRLKSTAPLSQVT